jgi:hypothetical protein
MLQAETRSTREVAADQEVKGAKPHVAEARAAVEKLVEAFYRAMFDLGESCQILSGFVPINQVMETFEAEVDLWQQQLYHQQLQLYHQQLHHQQLQEKQPQEQ